MTANDEQNAIDSSKAVVATDVEGEPKKLPYPKSIAFIISNEFCERFYYYGMRTILVLFLTRKLAYDDDTATIVYHVFTMLVHFMCMFGAILSDSWLGKFKTILYLSMVYVIGSLCISLGAIEPLHLPAEAMTLLGLCLVSLGSGGIKPCVAAFGGDQFEMPAQTKQMATYFSLFYFSINAGSLISSTVTPILRQDVQCFGDDNCYPLAFGLPTLLMVLSIVVFLSGKFLYKITPPTGNMVGLVSRCIGNAIATRWRESKFNHRDHWLEYAEPAFGKQLVHETRILLNVLLLYVPLPFFWALYDQQGSRWTFQATRMDGDLGWYLIKPDQMQVVNPLLILVFIPLYDMLLYPVLAKVGIRRPLQKLAMGGILAGIAFLCSGIVELQLESTYPILPQAGVAQFRLFNPSPCNYSVNTNLPDHLQFNLPAMDAYQAHVPYVGEFTLSMSSTEGATRCPSFDGHFQLVEAKAHSFYFAGNGLNQFTDDPAKTSSGLPAMRILCNLPMISNIKLADVRNDGQVRYNEPSTNQSLIEIAATQYEVRINDVKAGKIELRLGAIATLLVWQQSDLTIVNVVHVTEPNSVSMMWLMPQYIVMTLGEVMFSVTVLEFSYSQAPTSMKSVLQACWLLTVAFGNGIDIIIVGAKLLESQANEFFLFAGLMFIDMMLFMWLARRYKPLGVYVPEEEQLLDANGSTSNVMTLTKKTDSGVAGIENVALFTKEST